MGAKGAIGQYSGNGVNGRAIVGLGFAPLMVMIHHQGGAFGYFFYRTTSMVGGTGYISKSGLIPNKGITSLDADGFTVGWDNGATESPNDVGTNYDWAAWGGDTAEFAVGTYVGDAVASRNITCGFDPAAVMCAQVGVGLLNWRKNFPNPALSIGWDSGSGIVWGGYLIGSGASYFQVGPSLNTLGNTHYWFAWKERVNFCVVGSYSGNGADNRTIEPTAALRFKPQFINIDSDQGNGGISCAWHNDAFSAGDSTWTLRTGAPGSFADFIQKDVDTGFEVGAAVEINGAGNIFYYVMFGNGLVWDAAAPGFGKYADRRTGCGDPISVESADQNPL